MKLDNRNPFAAWGFEEEKYGVKVDEANGINEYTEDVKGFVNETVVDEAYNKVAKPISAKEYSEQHTDQMSFFTNNENMLPTSLANKAYGNDQELQREYPAGEPLNYYGNEADDLKLYGEPIVYNFTSYSSDGRIEFATGKAELIKVEGDLTYVKVIENSVEPEIWVGKEFYVNETEKNENDMYPLHNIDETTVVNVLIKLNETEVQEINEDYNSNEDSVITDNENNNSNTTVTNNTDDDLNNGNEGGNDNPAQTTDNTEAFDNTDGQ